MGLLRRLVTSAAMAAMAAGSLAGPTGTASATAPPVTPTSPGQHSYTFSIATAGSTHSTGVINWNNTTWALSMTANAGQLASGTCVTVYFDWRATAHHDARGVRDCQSNSTHAMSFPDSNPSNLQPGPARMGICYGTQDLVGSCVYYSVSTPNTIPMDWTPWPDTTKTNPCRVSFTRRASSGAVTTFVDPHSQRSVLQAGAC